MLERRRQQYLSLLDIETYIPTRLLPGAPPPVLLSPEQIVAPYEKTQNDKQVKTKPLVEEGVTLNPVLGDRALGRNVLDSSGLGGSGLDSSVLNEDVISPKSIIEAKIESPAAIQSILEPDTPQKQNSNQGLKDADSKIAENEDSPVQPSLSQSSLSQNKNELKFVLSVWRIRDQFLVIDSRQPGAAYPTDRLLQNMLRIMGQPLAQLPQSETVRWPLFVNKNASSKTIEQQNQDEAQASAMVQAYIAAQLNKKAISAIMLMGDDAKRFGLYNSAKFGEDLPAFIEGNADTNVFGTPILFMPSLFSMLQEPMLKAKAWAAIKAMGLNNL